MKKKKEFKNVNVPKVHLFFFHRFPLQPGRQQQKKGQIRTDIN